MLFNDGFWEVEIFLSESGYPGLKDVQDVIERLIFEKLGFSEVGIF
jgi:hypothetical protein